MKSFTLFLFLILLSGCSNIELQPRIPFIKVTAPAVAQIAPVRPSVQPNVVQAPTTDGNYQQVLTAYREQQTAFRAQQQEIAKLRDDLANVKATRLEYQQPIAITQPYEAVRLPVMNDGPVQPVRGQSRGGQGCDYLMRDLSRPGSKVVYCRPQG